MTISLILTGGTICCRTDADGLRRSDVSQAQTRLESGYFAQHPASGVKFAVQSPINRLSEDLTPPDLLRLLGCIAENDLTEISGILVAHGTDTLDQTAALLAAALPDFAVPLILVSAIAPPDAPDSNADANFAAAVSLIERGIAPGIWTVYQNTDGTVYLHRGSELLPCAYGAADFFSPHMLPVPEAPLAPKCEPQPFFRYDRAARSAEILLLRPHHGLRYDTLPLENVHAVVHGTYHSGTANSSDDPQYSVQTLLRRCAERQIPCFLAPCDPETAQYGSTAILLRAGAIPLNMPLTFAHMALWLGAMRGLSGSALTEFVREAYEKTKAL
ncbi:MAG: asparaginase [Oscillospiraceae bacterium]|nr:asparaginase [Oscillospiraceae bacterium]